MFFTYSLFKNRYLNHFLVYSLLGFFLTGCQLFTPKLKTPPVIPAYLPICTPITPDMPLIGQVACLAPFKITGKIGLKSMEHNGSAFYAWEQTAGFYNLSLSGILGIGHTTIEGSPTLVKLQNSNVGLLEAVDPEMLLLRATGWNAPIGALPFWIMGKARHISDVKSFDTRGRIETLVDNDWHAQFNYAEDNPLPNKLTMTKFIEGDDTRVILTIASREAIELPKSTIPGAIIEPISPTDNVFQP